MNTWEGHPNFWEDSQRAKKSALRERTAWRCRESVANSSPVNSLITRENTGKIARKYREFHIGQALTTRSDRAFLGCPSFDRKVNRELSGNSGHPPRCSSELVSALSATSSGWYTQSSNSPPSDSGTSGPARALGRRRSRSSALRTFQDACHFRRSACSSSAVGGTLVIR